MNENQRTVFLRPRTVALVLCVIIALLVGACTTAQAIRLSSRMPRTGVFAVLDLDGEFNLPTLFSAAMLLAASGLLHVIAQAKAAERCHFARHWRVLAFLFVALGVDEACSLHELLIYPTRCLCGGSGVFHFTWLIPGLAFVAVVSLAYARFVIAQPPLIRRLFILAAGLFLSGAVGMEMAGGYYISHHRCRGTATWLALTTIEETLEMVGVTVFIYALLRYLADHLPGVAVAFGEPRPPVG